MPTNRIGDALQKRSRLWVALCLLAIPTLSQSACTRDEVAAAIATIAIDLEATLQPWGATAVANAQSVATQVPSFIATSKASTPTNATVEVNQEQGALIPVTQTIEEPTQVNPSPSLTPPPPSATPSPTPSPTPLATATPLPSATRRPTATPTPYPNQIEITGGIMIRIPGGPFTMGATAERLVQECAAFRDGCQSDWFAASEPVHSVLLRSYYIDSHEVTNEAFKEFLNQYGDDCLGHPCVDVDESQLRLDTNGYAISEQLANYPATGMSWYGAAAYCAWRGARLPTEAEWEKAAAWDAEIGALRQYPWGDVFDGRYLNSCDASCEEPQANTAFDDGYPAAAPVASFAGGRSAYGLFDMAGNVWEWVADWYDPGYYLVSAAANPTGPESGEDKVVRGGSWFDTGNFAATSIRFPSAPTNADETIGFRCAADLRR